jgi:hypothetical protein
MQFDIRVHEPRNGSELAKLLSVELVRSAAQ